MATSPPVSDSDLIERMNAIRNSSERHVAKFHHEVERLKDWREHVKSRPFLAVGTAAIAGFWLVSQVAGGSDHGPSAVKHRPLQDRPLPHSGDDDSAEEVATKATLTAGAMGLLGSLASTAIRMAATHYVKSYFDKRTG